VLLLAPFGFVGTLKDEQQRLHRGGASGNLVAGRHLIAVLEVGGDGVA